MTKEIAQYCMKAYSQYHNEMCEECPIYGQTGDDHCFEDALQYVINHFDVIDKIRAEIESEKQIGFTPQDFADGLDMALEIIDKYKAESEDKE